MLDPYYTSPDGAVVLYLGRAEDVLPTLADGSVDHVITDPPYSDHTHTKQWIGAALTADGAPRVKTAHKELGFDALSPELRDFMAAQLRRLVRRWALAFSDLEGIEGWRSSLTTAGLDYVRTCIWDKVDGAPQFTGDRPAAGAEAIICAHQPGRKVWNGGGQRNVFRFAVNGDRGPKFHPSTKPLPLMRELVRLFTDEGDVLLDPFAGSGSTLLAAYIEGRRAIGIEALEQWAEIAAKRLEHGDAAARRPEQSVMAL